jgi:hypothetical protein
MVYYKQHRKFDSQRSARVIFDMRRKRIRKLLSLADDIDLIHAAWVLEWGREGEFQLPPGYDYPTEYLRAAIHESGRIQSWEVESILIEALGTPKRPGRRGANTRAWNFFLSIISALRSAENAEGGSIVERNIFREINRILYRQGPFQGRGANIVEAVKWYSIFANEELSQIYRSAIGADPHAMLRIGLILSFYFQTNFTVTDFSLDSYLGIKDEDVKAFFRVTADSLQGVRERCRQIVNNSSLAYRESPFRTKPFVLLNLANTIQYVCPLKDVLFWRVTHGLYYDVVDVERVKHIIGEEFEKFEARLLAAAYPAATILPEEPYGPKKLNKKTPDILISQNRSLKIAFECKAKRLPLDQKINISGEIRHSIAVKEIAKAVFQLVRFRVDLRSHVYDGLTEDPDAQYVVLTLDDWVFTGPATKDDVFELAREFLDQKGIKPDFDIRDVVLCTAYELDVLVTRLTLEQLVHLYKCNRHPEYQQHSPLPLANELFPGSAKWSDYPLAREFDVILPKRRSAG